MDHDCLKNRHWGQVAGFGWTAAPRSTELSPDSGDEKWIGRRGLVDSGMTEPIMPSVLYPLLECKTYRGIVDRRALICAPPEVVFPVAQLNFVFSTASSKTSRVDTWDRYRSYSCRSG